MAREKLNTALECQIVITAKKNRKTLLAKTRSKDTEATKEIQQKIFFLGKWAFQGILRPPSPCQQQEQRHAVRVAGTRNL